MLETNNKVPVCLELPIVNLNNKDYSEAMLLNNKPQEDYFQAQPLLIRVLVYFLIMHNQHKPEGGYLGLQLSKQEDYLVLQIIVNLNKEEDYLVLQIQLIRVDVYLELLLLSLHNLEVDYLELQIHKTNNLGVDYLMLQLSNSQHNLGVDYLVLQHSNSQLKLEVDYSVILLQHLIQVVYSEEQLELLGEVYLEIQIKTKILNLLNLEEDYSVIL